MLLDYFPILSFHQHFRRRFTFKTNTVKAVVFRGKLKKTEGQEPSSMSPS